MQDWLTAISAKLASVNAEYFRVKGKYVNCVGEATCDWVLDLGQISDAACCEELLTNLAKCCMCWLVNGLFSAYLFYVIDLFIYLFM